MSRSLDEELTACLIVYNEDSVIERCLRSIKRVTNNIIVVHDGECQDDTLKICAAYDCKVFVREHVGMCEGHRAWTYAQVKTPWILQVDADEFLSNELIHNIDSLIKDKSVACYELLWRYTDGQRYRTQNWPFKKALFQKELVQYLGFPHEEVRTEGVIKKVSFLIEHKPNYDNYSYDNFKKKHMKWIEIHAQYLLMNYDDLDRYPQNISHIKPHYSFIVKYPIIVAPFLFFYHFIGLMYYGGAREGLIGFRNCFMQSLYYFLLCLEVKKTPKEI